MLWFYWRRARLGVLITAVVLGSAFALVVVAGSVGQVRNHVAGQRVVTPASGAKLRRAALPFINPGQVSQGVALMNSAVAACRSISYSGEQVVAWWGSGDSTAYLIQVWHQSGEPEVADGAAGAEGQSGSIVQPGAAAAAHATAGVLTVAPWMLSRLRANYLLIYTGIGSADSRSASIVSVRRPDGTIAARYWLDRATGLPLRREMFDEDGRLVSEGAFIDVSFGDVDGEPVPPPIARAWSTQPTKRDLASLRRQGWPVPSSLAGNMALVGVSRTATNSGVVLDASYSDGLSVVSVFMQRGVLAGVLPGWSPANVHGLHVYSSEPDQRSLAWSADGVVYTVISDAPEGTVNTVVAQLPHESQAGLWQRVDRGLKRMGSWFDPFG